MITQNPPTELASLESQVLAAFRAGFLKASWDANTTSEQAVAGSDTGAAIERLAQVAQSCGEPVSTRILQLTAHLKSAYLEGFSQGKAPGATYEGLWERSAARKVLYFEPSGGFGSLCPGNMPKPGERWYITRDSTSTCQCVDVIDVTAYTVVVRLTEGPRNERLALDMTRFIEKAPQHHAEVTSDDLKRKYASKLNWADMDEVVAEARRQLGTMDATLLKCVISVLADRCATTVFHPKASA